MCSELNRSLRPDVGLADNSPYSSAFRRHDDGPDPKDNHLLAALIGAGARQILPALEAVALPLGLVLCEPGGLRPYVYFPTSGIVALLNVLEDGASTEIAVTGNEGVVGSSVFMGGGTSQNRATVIIAGYAYRLRAAVLKKEFEENLVLRHLLLDYMAALTSQIVQTAVCNRHHTIEQQLCRLLLLGLDRSPSSEIVITQEVISSMLGVRREGVTGAAVDLQTAGLIRYRRGHITVPDRSKLEQRACECYAVVKREYDRLLARKETTDIRPAIVR